MASKIIILSGNGRGIARIYEMTHKIRLEMDAVVTETNKRLGVMINDSVSTYPYVGRQIAIDLNPQKIHKASIIVYSDNTCLLSGSSNGKCDIPELMYLLSCHDDELERMVNSNNSAAEDMTELNADNSIIEKEFNAEAESSENNQNDLEVDDTVNSEINQFAEANENIANNLIVNTDKTQLIKNKPIERDLKKVELADCATEELMVKSATIDSINTIVVDDEEDKCMHEINVDTFGTSNENVEKVNDSVSIASNTINNVSLSDIDKIQVETTANKEHEVVAAMLEGKSEMNNESLPLGTVPFYEKIWQKLEEMFDIYQHDSVLEDLVYDSAWIRIPYEDDGYYVVGVISDDGKPVFICYGIPQDKMTRPDKEIEDSCEWLPIDKTDVSGRGYWLVYQDAMTGENIS